MKGDERIRTAVCVRGADPAYEHLWTMFCQGDYGPYPLYRAGWQIDICVNCYAKRKVLVEARDA